MGKFEDDLKEYLKLANTANTRLDYLRKNNMTNDTYWRAVEENENRGRENGKFSRSKKLTSQELSENLKSVRSFLNDFTSTMTGAKQEQSQLQAKNRYSKGDVQTKSREASKLATKVANKVQKFVGRDNTPALGKLNADLYVLGEVNKNASPAELMMAVRNLRGKMKGMSEKELDKYFAKLSEFNEAQTSTIRGENLRLKNIDQALISKNIGITKDNVDVFMEFVTSKTFANLKKYNSDQVLESFVSMMNNAENPDELDEIIESFKQYEQGELNIIDIAIMKDELEEKSQQKGSGVFKQTDVLSMIKSHKL